MHYPAKDTAQHMFEAEARRTLRGRDVSISFGRDGRILLCSDDRSVISGVCVEFNNCRMHLV